jgi:ketosteroid isomerase-like protein
VSRENVELVVGLYQPSGVDYVPLYRDDGLWAEQAEALAPFVHADFECVWYQFGSEKRYAGLDGLRDFMRDWTSPWVTYRIEIEEVIDLGERVLVLNHDWGRREGSSAEVRGDLGVIWTIRDGKVARLDVPSTRAEVLEAAGLAE